jgi:FemAB-related protein (PEP-CTERM system-associated)
MQACRLLSHETSAWDHFVRNHAQGTFFHLSGWREVMQQAFGHQAHFIALHAEERLIGVLPLVEIRSRLFGHSLISNAFCVGGGPLALDEKGRLTLLAEAERLGRLLKVDYVELRDSSTAPGWIARDDLYANFARELESDQQKNLLQIPRKQRAVVRKALEGDFEVTIDTSLTAFYPIYARTVRDHGTPVLPRRFFTTVMQVFRDHCDILTVWKGGRPLSSVLSFYFGDKVLPYYTGSDPAARELGTNDLMYWKLMRHAVAKGCRVFDFGRSKIGTGPYSFKKNWGFEPRPIPHQFLLVGRKTLPNLNPTNPKFSLLINTWRRLPLPIANLISPIISRDLG